MLRCKPWKRPKDLPKGEIWPPDQGLHPIPESWKEEVRRGYPRVCRGRLSGGQTRMGTRNVSRRRGVIRASSLRMGVLDVSRR